MDRPLRHKILIASVVAAILVLASLVSASINIKKFRKSFRDEMAQRLDLEEKISVMEKERQALLSELETLKGEVSKGADEVASLRETLDKELKEKASLQETLNKAEAAIKVPMKE